MPTRMYLSTHHQALQIAGILLVTAYSAMGYHINRNSGQRWSMPYHNELPHHNELPYHNELPRNNEVSYDNGLPFNNELPYDNGLPYNNELPYDKELPFNNQVEGTLRSVLVLHRHGHRLPLEGEIYPNDVWNFETVIKRDGYGALTNLGKRQEYNLGRQLRNRYKDFLSEIYSPKWSYSRSTDFERTQMSGQSVLTGLYPPMDDQVWNTKIPNWQPVPLYSFPQDNDPILLSTPCPRFEKYMENLTNSEQGKNFTEEYQQVFNEIGKIAGKGMDLVNASELCLMIEIEKGFRLVIPPWTKKYYPQPLKTIVGITYALEAWTPELKRLRSGNLINYILDIMKSRINGTSERQITTLSAHDNTLVILYRGLGFDDFIKPEFASSIILELHEMSQNRWEVKMFLDESGRAENWQKLSIPNCNDPCTFNQFAKAQNDVIDLNWSESCRL